MIIIFKNYLIIIIITTLISRQVTLRPVQTDAHLLKNKKNTLQITFWYFEFRRWYNIYWHAQHN